METILINLAVAMTLMSILWGVSLILRDASIIDPFWGTGFVLIAWVSALINGPADSRMMLIAGLVTVWGGRLSVYLFWRNFGKQEDARYVAMRNKHGQRFWWVSLFTVFWLQAVLMWLISFPFQVAATSASEVPLGWLDAAGVAVWLLGFVFESVGDWQLARFRSNPDNRGKVLDTGLWRYTRHPNYFGDFCVWWGFYMISINGGGSWTFFGPLMMSIFLMKVSGVTLLEKDISERRPEYEEYKRRTSPFFPRRPRPNVSG